jgi:exodeoxyribonuclease-3
MKAATFNANSIRARMHIITRWLERESPDILCLQETKMADSDFPEKEFRAMGYQSVFRGRKGRNGVATLSKSPPEYVRIGFDEEGSEGDRVITTVIGGIPVVNTYVPQGISPFSDEFRAKLDWLQRLYDYFGRHFSPRKPLLWMGDFNMAPEPEDVYAPEFLAGHVGFHPDEQAALERFRRWGMVDVFRMHHAGPGHYSFWDYQIRNAVKKGQGWRLDHIWATRPLAKKSTACRIDVAPRLEPKPSDHTFVVAVFEI